MKATSEIRALTGLRGMAALLVALYHFTRPDLMPLPYAPPLVLRGYLAVDLFFVLSGFVMILNYGSTFHDRVRGPAVRRFLSKRFARIYPAYAVISLYSIVRLYRHGQLHGDDLLPNLLMVQGWGFGAGSLLASSWSVSTEIVAYMLLPGIVVGLSHARHIRAALLCAVLAGVLAVCTFGHGARGALDVTAGNSMLPLVRCLVGFVLGVLAYDATRSEPLMRHAKSAVLLLGIFAFIVLSPWDLLVFFLFPLLVIALYEGSAVGDLVFANPLCVYLGTISYSLYLVHPFVQLRAKEIAVSVAQHHGPTMGNIVGIVVATAAACVLAMICYHLVEAPGRIFLASVGRRAVRRPV